MVMCFVLQLYHMSQQTIFVREYYQKDTHFNPVSSKIKPNKLKKTQEITQIPHSIPHQRLNQLSAAKNILLKPQNNHEKFNYALTGSPMRSEQISKYRPTRSEVYQVDQFSHIVESQRSFLMQRNKELQIELKNRDSKLTVLGRRCEQLQMQLLAVSSSALDNSSSNWSQINNFPKSTKSSVVNEKSNNLQKLKAIRDRLQKIDFSRFFSAASKSQ